jgi:prevent-host-death family protein
MKDMAITDARHELTALPDQLASSHETLTVTRRGKPVLAILPWDEYEALVETLEVLSDADAMAALRQGLREARAGKAIPWEQAKRKLGL